MIFIVSKSRPFSFSPYPVEKGEGQLWSKSDGCYARKKTAFCQHSDLRFPGIFPFSQSKKHSFLLSWLLRKNSFFYFGIFENAGGHVKQRALTGFRRCRFSQFHTNSTRRGIIVNKSTTRQKQKHRKNKKKVPNLYDSELFPSMYLVEISGIEPLTS